MTEAIDICEVAAAALRAAGMAEAKAQPLTSLDRKDGVVVRLMPPVTRRTYMDGSRLIDCTMQVIAKGLDEYAPMDACERAARVLTGADLSSANGSYEAVGLAEQDGDVERLGIGADRRHVWAVRVREQIIRQ